MSAFYGLADERERLGNLQILARNPLPLEDPLEHLFSADVGNVGKAVARGVSDLATAAAVTGAGVVARALPEEEAIRYVDPIFEQATLNNRLAQEYLASDPRELSAAGRVVGDVVRGVTPYLVGPTLGGVTTATRTATELSDLGVDSESALKASLLTGTAGALGYGIPIFGRTLPQRILAGALGNTALGVAVRSGEEAVIAKSTRKDLAEQFGPSWETTAVDLLTGAAFGGWHHYLNSRIDDVVIPEAERVLGRKLLPWEREELKPGPEFEDAARTAETAEHFRRGTAPGEPVDLRSYNQHRQAVEQAIKNVLNDEPVEVPTTVDEISFVRTPSAANVYSDDFREVLRQEGVPDFIDVFHGSPHIGIERFSLQKIGTGEGAQAFGWGLYFADSQAIAESYRTGLTQKEFIRLAQESYSQYETPEEATSFLLENPELSDSQKSLLSALQKDDWLGFDYPHQAIRAAYREPENFDLSPETVAALKEQGTLYATKLQIRQDTLLDWDKKFNEQSAKVQASLKDVLAEIDTLRAESEVRAKSDTEIGVQQEPTGEEIYAHIVEKEKGDQRTASEYLNSLGIRGLKYLDAASRKAGEGSHNYVVWDESVIGKPTDVHRTPLPERPSEKPQAEVAPPLKAPSPEGAPRADKRETKQERDPVVEFVRATLEQQGDVEIPTGNLKPDGSLETISAKEWLRQLDEEADQANDLVIALKGIGGCNPEIEGA